VELRAESAGQGLRAIRGDIIIDDTAFSLPAEDPGAFDGKPNRSYNVLPDALMVNFQSVEFRLAADADTREVAISATPAPFNLIIDNHIRFATAAAPRTPAGSTSRWLRKVGIVSSSAVPCRRIAPGAASAGAAEAASYAYGTFVQLCGNWRRVHRQAARRAEPRGCQGVLHLRFSEPCGDHQADQ